MLPKHPDLMPDDELGEWVAHLVDDLVEEGPRLDYKETADLDAPSGRRDVARDVSSFANEAGGTILYGIGEDRTRHGRPIPRKPYGIAPIAGFESRIENILVDSIRPTLAEWRLRSISLGQRPRKVVYLVWTPESWAGVHMVEAYGDHRYYRRGQFRAVEMTEREVRDRYDRLLSARGWLDAFLDSAELNYIEALLPPTYRSHYVICPVTPLVHRVDFSSRQTRDWLQANPCPPSRFRASPYGARTYLEVDYARQDWQPYTELHNNCAISQWRRARVVEPETAIAYIRELENIYEFLDYAKKFYAFVGYTGPLRTVIGMSHPDPGAMARVRFPYPQAPPWPKLLTHDNRLRLSIEESAMTLSQQPKRLLKAIADEMFRAFGYWEADCFDESLNLVSR
jgi:hypothetical protein